MDFSNSELLLILLSLKGSVALFLLDWTSVILIALLFHYPPMESGSIKG